MGRKLYHEDFSKMTQEEFEEFLLEDTPLEQVKAAHPEWKKQLEKLEREINKENAEPWKERANDKMRFALILNKCRFFAKLWKGEIFAQTGPFPDNASITMYLPSLVFVRDIDENLIRYLGRYAQGFSVHPRGDGIKVTIDLPYPQEGSHVIHLHETVRKSSGFRH